MEPDLIASRRHTAIVTAIFVAIAVAGFVSTHGRAIRANAQSRLSLYVSVIVLQWLLLRYVIAGMRRYGKSLFAFVRWNVLDALLGIGLFFLLGWMLPILRRALGDRVNHTDALLPRGHLEVVLWVLVALTAGVCEELVFRGYLLEQYSRLAGSRTAAAILQAVLFGISHGYQGWESMVTISVFGAIAAAAVVARRNVMPMIVAHALTDLSAAFLRH